MSVRVVKYAVLIGICMIFVFSTCTATINAESIVSKVEKINDINSDPDGRVGMNLEGIVDPLKICSVHRRVCSIHYSLSILGYSLLNYESKPVTPSTEGFFSGENNLKDRIIESKDKKEEEEQVLSGNPNVLDPIQQRITEQSEDVLMNKISPNDEPAHSTRHEYSADNGVHGENDEERVINVADKEKEIGNRSKQQRTYSSMNHHREELLYNRCIYRSLFQAITLFLDSCLNWSFCTFILLLYYMTQVKRNGDISQWQSEDRAMRRRKSRVSGDFVRDNEAVKGENEHDTIHQILNEILMKVQLMDTKSELVANGLLRILFIWNTLIKEVITAHQRNDDAETDKREGNSDEGESTINQREMYHSEIDDQLSNLDEEMFGQSILDESDSHLVPDFSSDEEEEEVEERNMSDAEGGEIEDKQSTDECEAQVLI